VDQESLASSVLLARQSSDPTLGKLSQALLAVRRRLAQLTLSTPQPGQEKRRLKQIEELNHQEQELGKQLRQASSRASAGRGVEPSELRRAMPADAVLIDLAHLEPFDFQAKPDEDEWLAARYAAWVTPRSGPVRLIDLGPAEKIDGAVSRLRK